MVISIILIIIIATVELGLTENLHSRAWHKLTISDCAAKVGECDESRGHPVCGTDDQTYPTRCHLQRVQCGGHQVSLKYRGPCKACKEARDYAVKHKALTPPNYIPRCKRDGTYASIQCLSYNGCWCSDITGKPIENTSVRTGKPSCRDANKNIRRSTVHQPNARNNKHTCNQADHILFNSNLIKVFQSEFIRSGSNQFGNFDGVQRDLSAGLMTSIEKVVLDWKFSKLDENSNNMLDKNEFRELKQLVKRAVKPKRCGRFFGKFCDVDNDGRLTQNEWKNCLSKDGTNHPSVDHNINDLNSPSQWFNKYNSKTNEQNQHSILFDQHQQPTQLNNRHNNIPTNNSKNTSYTGNNIESKSDAEIDESTQHLDYNEDADYDPEEGINDENLSKFNTFGLSTKYPSIYFLRPKAETPLRESEAESDCLADQAAALEEQRLGGTILYVPECTADGRYQNVQCYRSTPYCWCVHEDSGKNIPGTSVKNKRPQCEESATSLIPMKGCPEPKKTQFLKDLREFFKSHIYTTNTYSGGVSTMWSNEDEQLATLSFALLDKNKNNFWERKEWKIFRELMTRSKALRNCGKKFPRHCDVNMDKKITLSEWLFCLQTQNTDASIHVTTPYTSEPVTPRLLKLTGSNPLEQYLKD